MQALITGAGRGIGRGLAEALAAKGVAVVGTHRGAAPDAADNLAWMRCDMARPEEIAALGEAFAGKALDLLVCNAGVYLEKGRDLLADPRPDLWAETFAVNVTGAFLCVQALMPALRRARGARIALISSIMASDERAPGGSYIYRASKAALLNLGRNLATDLRPEGIAVGIYHPGWVRTDMGGPGAEIDTEEAVSGLVAQLGALDIGTSGTFRDHTGQMLPF